MSQELNIITGGAGFIGSHLCRSLLEDGQRVRVVDNFSTGKTENLSDLSERYGDRLEIIEHDIRNESKLNKLFDGATVVYHQAAVPSVPQSILHPIDSTAVNISGTLNVLVAARDSGVRKVIYASSSAVYGDSEVVSKGEDISVHPLSPYAVAKRAGEMFGEIFPALFNLDTVGLRYFNVFGPAQDLTSEYSAVIPRFVMAMLSGESPIIYGDGEQSRDFIFVDDVVLANRKAAGKEVTGTVINIACGESHTLNELVAVLNRILNTNIEPVYKASRPGDVRHSQADIHRAQNVLDFRPQVSLEEGLRKVVSWLYQKNKA